MQTSRRTWEAHWPDEPKVWETEQGGRSKLGSSTKHKSSQDTLFSQVTDLTEITSFSEPSEEEEEEEEEVDIGFPINGSYESIRIDSVAADKCDSLFSCSIPHVHNDESFPVGMPSEILWIDAADSAKIVDVNARLKFAEILVNSYQDTLKSNECLIESLHRNLLQTQGYAEDLLDESDTLLKTIQDMEQDNAMEDDRNLLLKAAVCFSLFFYLCGGSEYILVASISLFMLQDFINTLFLS